MVRKGRIQMVEGGKPDLSFSARVAACLHGLRFKLAFEPAVSDDFIGAWNEAVCEIAKTPSVSESGS